MSAPLLHRTIPHHDGKCGKEWGSSHSFIHSFIPVHSVVRPSKNRQGGGAAPRRAYQREGVCPADRRQQTADSRQGLFQAKRKQDFLFTMPRYEGTYRPLREHPFCNACGKARSELRRELANKTLSLCSRCKMVWYCSVACQKRNYARHKRICRDIATLQAETDAEFEPLKSLVETDEEGRPTNVSLDAARMLVVRMIRG